MINFRSYGLILLRLAQLARPLLFIAILRIWDVDAAGLFVKYVSVYVLLLEIHNVIYPTDRLYLKNSNKSDLNFTISRRLTLSAVTFPLTIVASFIGFRINLYESLMMGLMTSVGALSTAFLSFSYPRSSNRTIFQSEIISTAIIVASFFVFLYNPLIGFTLYYIEQIIKSIYLTKVLRINIIKIVRLSARVRYKSKVGLAGIGEGLSVTLSNQISRMPFAFSVGSLDPIYFIAAQVQTASYNMFIATKDTIGIKVTRVQCLILLGLGFASLAISSMFLSYALAVPFNLAVVCGFALVHSIQLVDVPGRTGIASAPLERLLLILGMAVVGLGGLLLDVRLFLFAPVILLLVGFVFDRRHAEV